MRALAAPALALGLALAGCGAAGDRNGGDTSGPGGDDAEPATALELTVWPEGQDAGRAESWTLECDPAGGTHPAPDTACTLLADNADLLEPLPDDVMCTQQFGGPEQASIRGTFQGREVDLRYSRANGCEIARWERLAPVLQADAS
ncbi:MAG TPA: SSI family serine proteinase inhibitor [Gaiellaceae bacterium]|nr:SSI family serine proteinase inhibitor [Gaiellaceae bacterium]